MRHPDSGQLRVRALSLAALLVSLLTACGKGPTGGTNLTISSIVVLAGDGQQGAAGEAVAIEPRFRVVGAQNQPLAGVTVTFSPSGTGTVERASVTTNSAGEATPGAWKLGTTPGQYTLSASTPANGSSGVTIGTSITAVALPGPAAQMSIVSGNGQTGAIQQPLANDVAVQVRDRFGNLVPGVAVSFAATLGGQASPSSATTDATGRASTRWILGGTAGPQQLTASVAGTSATATFVATATALRPRLEITTQPSAAAMTMLTLDRPPVVRALDASGAAIAQTSILATIDGTVGAAVRVGDRVATAADGVARFSSLSIGTGAGTPWTASTLVRLRFEATGFDPVVSDTIRLSCFALALPLDRPFTNSGTIQPGDCGLGNYWARDFYVDVPTPGAGVVDNVTDLLLQATPATVGFDYPRLVIRGAGAQDDERFQFGINSFSLPLIRRRVLVGPGRTTFTFSGPSGLISMGYTFASNVQAGDTPSPCLGDQTFIPMQSAISFTQRLATNDCQLSDRTYADRYGIPLPPGAEVTFTVDALESATPGLAAYVYPSTAGDLNSAGSVEVARGTASGRTISVTVQNRDVITRLYSIAVSALTPSTVGQYRSRVSFRRP